MLNFSQSELDQKIVLKKQKGETKYYFPIITIKLIDRLLKIVEKNLTPTLFVLITFLWGKNLL